MSWLIIKLEKKVGVLPEDGIPSPTAVINSEKNTSNSNETTTANSNGHIVPVLSAAIHKFRSRNK
jgi:oxaloacetate decarboxylase gamma subunit